MRQFASPAALTRNQAVAIVRALFPSQGLFAMKFVFRVFFKTLRIVIAPLILLWELVTTPKGVVRSPDAQRQIDAECRNLALYQFRTCPFCVKVRREIKRLSLNIDLLDAQHSEPNRAVLQQGGGKVVVPCLRITDAQGKIEWMYESAQIIQYLHTRFA
jgi:glutaredoxin